MRRNSLLILLSMIVLLVVIAVLLFYIFGRSSASTVPTGTVVPATLPVPPGKQVVPLSEPVGMLTRFVYIVSVLIVFVSAVLILFRMLLGISGKHKE
jgi:hypothetical protein